MPRVIPDEMVYGLVGQSLYHSGSLEILGGPTPFYSFVFPAFVGLPLSLSDLELGYALLGRKPSGLPAARCRRTT